MGACLASPTIGVLRMFAATIRICCEANTTISNNNKTATTATTGEWCLVLFSRQRLELHKTGMAAETIENAIAACVRGSERLRVGGLLAHETTCHTVFCPSSAR